MPASVRVVRFLPLSARATSPPIVIRPGDRLTVDERSDEWPAFVFVRNERGQAGWVPEQYVEQRDGAGRATREFDTTSLEPAVGDLLTVLEDHSDWGWARCRDERGREGWFATDFVRPA
ncbi:MAG: SH3 domain-containing protein [Thermoplasmata archaeon]